jgi:hypothetical protein
MRGLFMARLRKMKFLDIERYHNLLPARSIIPKKEVLKSQGNDEDGSITPLISLYFTIAMLMIFVIANAASTYIARRDLINATEAALSKAAQELDEFVYYYQVPIPSSIGGQLSLVPINCSDAGGTLSRELNMLYSREGFPELEILDFNCNGRVLTAEVQQRHLLPFAANVLGIDSFVNRVSITAISKYR